MKIVLDVNVILSALIKDSTTRRLLLYSDLDFYFPQPSLNKIAKYKRVILSKSGLSDTAFQQILRSLLAHINLVSKQDIFSHWKAAKSIMAHIDQEDVVFIAAALHLGASIWSDDKDFEKQNKVKAFKTEDIAKSRFL